MSNTPHIPPTERVHEVLCIDVGGTVTDPAGRYTGGPWLDNPENYLDTPLLPGFEDALGRLVTERFDPAHVYFVSKCKVETEARTRELFEALEIHGRFGIPRDNFRFTRTRDKSAEVRAVHGTHMVDDRLEVLSHLIGVVPYLHLINPSDEVFRFPDAMPHVIPSIGWAATARNILRTPHLI